MSFLISVNAHGNLKQKLVSVVTLMLVVSRNEATADFCESVGSFGNSFRVQESLYSQHVETIVPLDQFIYVSRFLFEVRKLLLLSLRGQFSVTSLNKIGASS